MNQLTPHTASQRAKYLLTRPSASGGGRGSAFSSSKTG